ncbi:Hypothetical predicted protein [Mytilus galloprovincialis]|uniref:Mab-21-like HhH/H2TH-like domain-containing protein n=1 Tax=Mytilus galloprovincialis TaxID=29158 RepID=A0A8B6DUP3_MYTGA|nr:Hypothetical predicted protein [Mytilus galloprovincialis]
MADISRQIYQYMCDEIVGSEKVVKYRRLFFKVYEYVQNNFCSPSKYIIPSGSKAEGLNLPGSDIDIMLISKKYIVYESKLQRDNARSTINTISLVIDTDHAQPGFALLCVQNELFCERHFVERNEDGMFLSSKLYLLNFATKYTCHKINGPCISNKDGKLDAAHSLQCPQWPSIARNWATRKRSSGWPSVFLLSDIVQLGVHFVPIGSKSRSDCIHPLEWRISFSVPEKILINTWNHTQLLCYAILKILLTEVIRKSKGIDSLMCSYFLKTVLLWLLEEVDTRKWTPESLLDCVVMCLGRLTYLITHKYIPNYFIPEHNMIDRQFNQQSWDELLALISYLHDIGWQSIFLCDSFQYSSAVFKWKDNRIRAANGNSDFMKAIIPLMNILFKNYRFLDVTYCTKTKAFTKYFKNIMTKSLPYKYKVLQSIMLSSLSYNMTESLLCKQQCNKQSYVEHKQLISCNLICAQTCVVSGWTLQALNFYLCGQYHIALRILEFAILLSSSEQLIISPFYDIHMNDLEERHFISSNYISCLRKFKYYTRLDIFVNDIYTFDYLLQMNPYQNSIFLDTDFCLHYLRFACCHRLRDIDAIQQSLLDLEVFRDDEVAETYIENAYDITFNRYHEQNLCWRYNEEKRKLFTNVNHL